MDDMTLLARQTAREIVSIIDKCIRDFVAFKTQGKSDAEVAMLMHKTRPDRVRIAVFESPE
jgi:hypothetical protein